MRLLLASALLLQNISLAAAQGLPTDVSTRVGRAGEFTYRYTSSQYAHNLKDRDVFWSNQPSSQQGGADKLHFPRGVFSGAYTTINRVPVSVNTYGATRIITACGVPMGGGCTLDWFQTNHPTWIIYKTDQATPAYQYGNKNWIPLDISNVDVQAWIKANVFAPILNTGYQAISVDNVSAQNDFGEVGYCSIKPVTNCTTDGGTWTQLYTGAVYRDDAFADNRIAWARTITTFAHSMGKSTMANITYSNLMLEATTSLINAFDVWYDESGFTGSSVPSDCSPNSLSAVIGKKWIDKVNFITRLSGGAGPNAYISQNSICPFDAVRRPGGSSNFEMVELAIASYLIVKNAHTYLWMYFDNGHDCGVAAYCDNKAGASWPQYWLRHGVASGPFSVTNNVYNRSFAHALALVNPSTTTDYTFDLGPSVYRRSDCSRWTHIITVPKQTGMVLLPETPAACLP